jgi:hypothetical protein
MTENISYSGMTAKRSSSPMVLENRVVTIKRKYMLNMVVRACTASTQEAEAVGS